jgi:chitinase
LDALERAYQSVVSKYNVQIADFDVEGASLADFPATQLRARAVAALQAALGRRHQQLQVWLTLPVEPDGLQPDAVAVIDTMLRARVSLAGVNIMAMDYSAPPGPGQTMFDLARLAVSAAHRQLEQELARYGVRLSSRQVWHRLGVTVMVGQNDFAGQVFTTADAQSVARFASNVGLGRLSMWSLNRDTECGQAFGENDVLSNTCSGTSQSALAFSRIFGALGGIDTLNERQARIVPPVPDTNPANALYPLWSPTAEYQAGYKVVREGYVYEAKWYNVGEDPAQLWQYSWQTPWELVGPVLPSDHAPKMPVLPAGTYPAWSPHRGYQPGDNVLCQGLPYQAKWYNQGQSPTEEASDPYGSPWQPLFTLPGEPGPD